MIAEACTRYGVRLIALSSTSVYGTQADVVDEDCSEDELKPQSPYATTKLKEERLVQNIGSGFSLQRDSSLFTISAYLEPEHLEQVEALICQHLFDLQQTPISAEEIRRCQRLLCNDYIFSTEAAGQIAGLYGYYNTIASAELAVTYPAQIQRLTPIDLMHLAQRYLSPYHYAVTVLKPVSEDLRMEELF